MTGCRLAPCAGSPRELRRYFADPQAEISGEQIRRDTQVVRVTVATSLDEAVADAAFVRFIRDSKL